MTFSNQNPPSRNPTNNDSMVGMFDIVLSKFLQNYVDDTLPAQVISYDRTTNLAQVQPLISRVTTSGTIVQRATVQSVPVYQYGAGQVGLFICPKAGDLGFIKANDCDISLFKQLWKMVIPNTARKHNFADAIFFPSILTGLTINSEDATNAVLQTIDGTVRVAIWPGKVKVTAPEVDVVSPIVNVTASTSVTITSPSVIITGTLQVNANITSGSGVGAVDLLNHVHSDAGGTGNSGPPVGGT